MNKLFRPTAAAALFVTAAFVACNGSGGYPPSVSQDDAMQSSQATQPLTTYCTAKQEGPGTYLSYVATGNTKGTTFTLTTGKDSIAEWELVKYKRVKPTPPPSPSPTPSTSPSPTPKPVTVYIYYGTFATKIKQVGCAILITTESQKPFKGANYNGLTEGAPNLKSDYGARRVTLGNIKTLVISHLSSKGGSGTMTLVQKNGNPYTTGSISLKGRLISKDLEQVQQYLKLLAPAQ